MAISGRGPIPAGVCRVRLKGRRYVGDWICGNKAGDDGLCGVHRAVRERKQALVAAQEEYANRTEKRRKEVDALAREFIDLGFPVSHDGTNIILTPTLAKQVLRKLQSVASGVTEWYEVQTNSDLSEGRGSLVRVMETAHLGTALKAVKGIGPQGSDGQIVSKRLTYRADGVPKIEVVKVIYGRRWEGHQLYEGLL